MSISVFKQSVFVLMVLSLIGLNTVHGANPSHPPAPSLEIPNPDHDFGEVPEGEKISHAFTLKNTGTGVLKIHRVQPG